MIPVLIILKLMKVPNFRIILDCSENAGKKRSPSLFILYDQRSVSKFWGWLCIPVFLIVFATGLTKLVLHKRQGPFVHVSSMVAVLLTKLTSNIRGIYADKARNMEMLAAACAVGVTAAFAAPIGGVLFSIEVTAVHFAVRNYWRGFYAAVCGTVMHRFLAVWFNENADFTAVYKTSFYSEEPYALPELIFFALMGAIIGVIGALFVWSNRKCTMFKNNNRIMKTINRNSVFWYPYCSGSLHFTSSGIRLF
ncbi:Chloride channel protein 2 [Armadillidium vulgare]|nr:Chloride channel protein 2 [Armadillidium vulgare]